jgi:hypothetical protein
MSLHPDHLADLRKSDLSDESIKVLRIQSVRPHEINMADVTSAYRIPYFHLDGTVNCFERWKLLPPRKTKDGTQKYSQSAGSDSHLYLPRICPWTSVASDTSKPVLITEGEKKAAKACQEGLSAIGVAGLWNFLQKLDSGERLVIPTLDQFQWTAREVPLIPDSDAWRPDRELALAGFYELGQELISRGATVHLLRLPEKNGTKVGFDDWLVTEGSGWRTSWPHLKRLRLDDPRFKSLAAWWQKRREKQALEEQYRSEQRDPIDLSVAAGLYRVACRSHHVTFEFDRLTDARGGVTAELTVTLGATELLGSTDIGLKADSARDKIAKTLSGLTLGGKLPWKRLLGLACTAVLKMHRTGTPVITLEPNEHTTTHVPFILNPLIYRGHQTLAFAPGGSCKSYLALYFALLACHGQTQAGVGAVKTPVLYLDWELDAETVTGRLKAIQTGHPELGHIRPSYRRCEYPLHQEVHQIAAHVARLGVQFLVIDSAALACGGDLASPDSAIKLQRALRTIGCASLVLAHVPKSVQEGQESTAYGTVFFRELARNVWEFQRTNETNPVRVALHQKKNNFGPALPPLGFEVTFSHEAVRIGTFDPAEEPQCEEKLPVASRIRNLLDDGQPRSAKDIADELNLKQATIKVTLSRHRGFKWHMTGENQEAKWTVLNR